MWAGTAVTMRQHGRNRVTRGVGVVEDFSMYTE